MSANTVRLRFEPLSGPWVGGEADPESSAFSAPWSSTEKVLRHELDMLGVEHAVVEFDGIATMVRNDGTGIRSNARPYSGRVRLTFTLPDTGPVSLACDRWDGTYGGVRAWEINLRAIALTMQALRAVQRYGVARGHETYVGFAALPSGTPVIVGEGS